MKHGYILSVVTNLWLPSLPQSITTCWPVQSNPLKWIALGPDYEYPFRQSIHLSMLYTFLHCVKRDQTNDIYLDGLST